MRRRWRRLSAAGWASSETLKAEDLLSAAAVRAASGRMLQLGLDGALEHWRVDLGRLSDATALTAEVVREQYPTLSVPFHARWRHFAVGERDLWAELGDRADWREPAVKARAAFDLAITSVLLDAGAGPGWAYRDAPTGETLTRSEGLGIASFRMVEGGVFSTTPGDPVRVDADRLRRLSADALADGFQVSADNTLVGLYGRAALLRRLGEQVAARPDLFALQDAPRPGGLFDLLASRAEGGRLRAPMILEALLEALGPIWENRPILDGVALGDCWPHPAFGAPDAAEGYVPLHKLSQWLSYSLVEPLQEAGVEVVDLDRLTGLAEYRNGGLFIDTGVLTLRSPADAERAWDVSHPLIVGWRSMTVALLDQIAPLVRERLGVTAAEFPLARVLEGGTWAAGRRTARDRRDGGGPPLTIISDGTVF